MHLFREYKLVFCHNNGYFLYKNPILFNLPVTTWRSDHACCASLFTMLHQIALLTNTEMTLKYSIAWLSAWARHGMNPIYSHCLLWWIDCFPPLVKLSFSSLVTVLPCKVSFYFSQIVRLLKLGLLMIVRYIHAGLLASQASSINYLSAHCTLCYDEKTNLEISLSILCLTLTQ